MNWRDKEATIELYPPKEFNFDECLIFLNRSNLEILHQVKEGSIYKLIKVKEALLLCKLDYVNHAIIVEFPAQSPSSYYRKKVAEYFWEWFDLEQNLEGFYEMARQDKVLKTLVHRYHGLRILCIPDLFEALVWAIMGQQINLTFAYTLKKRFVEQFGESMTCEGETYWLFPSFEKIALLDVAELRELQFTSRKAEYIIGIAKMMANGDLSKGLLFQKNECHEIKKSLMTIRGVGAWTADYVMMKCLHLPSSFPVADVGLHNALKQLLSLENKPSISEVQAYAANWEGWEAYATFYLWRSLYD
ncbi:DNA-3-methyladenine glycosylase [Bacillus sp. THAF10]|uniref:DNA-3-methyladenine glycosylase family protein n=1 Tax=Bacillus sp. THAF10 TaxID=2587848 RepID=UPI00126909D2|nr:DNA-3-methyladenine glycosylase [Bacillus sp. THAF10]QFT91122.1 DNA-3-methyladenine glycosylase [Bacillus sp. THAF10]